MVIDNQHAKYVTIDIVRWRNDNRFTRSGSLKRPMKTLVRLRPLDFANPTFLRH